MGKTNREERFKDKLKEIETGNYGFSKKGAKMLLYLRENE